MQQYLNMINRVLNEGTRKPTSAGVDTLSVFGHQERYSLSDGFPLVTTKRTHLRSIIHELLFFITGETNNNWLKDRGVSIWNEWADDDGYLGPIYGYQWRKWPAAQTVETENGHERVYNFYRIDQLQEAIDTIRNNPNSRRIIVSAWNPADIKRMALPPCHSFFQFDCKKLNPGQAKMYKAMYQMEKTPEYGLSLQMYQRSADLGLGVPFNIASYALLLMMVAKITDTVPLDFVHTIGDLHIYENHIPQLKEQLAREPRDLPIMYIDGDQKEIGDFEYTDFHIVGYDPHPHIKMDVAVVK